MTQHKSLTSLPPEEADLNGQPPKKKKKRSYRRPLRIAGWTVGALLVSVIALFTTAYLYLTPARLSRIMDRKVSEYLNADLATGTVSCSFIKSFPNITVTIDSVSLRSRSMRGHSALPYAPDPDRLLSASSVSIRSNLLHLLKGDLNIQKITVDSLDLQLIALNGEINNYSIIPPGKDLKNIPAVTLGKLSIHKPARIRYVNLEQRAELTAMLAKSSIQKIAGGFDRYQAKINGKLSAGLNGRQYIYNFPISLFGDIDLNFNPLSISLTDFQTNSGDVHGVLSLSAQMGTHAVLNHATYQVMNIRPRNILKYVIPNEEWRTTLSKMGLLVNLSARLSEPWTMVPGTLPSFRADIEIPYAEIFVPHEISYERAKSYNVRPTLVFDGSNPANSYIDIPKFYILGDKVSFDATAHITDINRTPRVNCQVNAMTRLENFKQYIPALRSLNLSGGMKGSTSVDFIFSHKDGVVFTKPVPLTLEVRNFKAQLPNSLNLNFNRGLINATLNAGRISDKAKSRSALDMLAQLNPKGSLQLDRAVVRTPRFNNSAVISNINLNADRNTLTLRGMRVQSASSSATLHGVIAGIAQFAANPKSAPLSVSLTADCDTLQLNHLARAYTLGTDRHGRQNLSHFDRSADAQRPSDTVPLRLPANISASVSAKAKMVRYMNLRLENMVADINLKNRVLDIDTLSLGADFGHAGLSARIDTSNPYNTVASGAASFTHLNVVRFFDSFHALLLSMPEAANLSGVLSGDMRFRAMAFPDMYLNLPSVWSDIHLMADSLELRQSPLIHRIADMILIHTDAPLHVADIDMHATVTDNLLEVYPFIFRCNRYMLQLGGLNNFNGDLYYHVGVDKSPVPFRFGVNVTGEWSKPHLDFGEAAFSNHRSRLITTTFMSPRTINLRRAFRSTLNEAVRKASQLHADTISL